MTLRDSKDSTQYAIGLSIAAASGRLDAELDKIKFSQWLPNAKEIIASIFDKVIELHMEYGSVDLAANIVAGCFSYLDATDGLFFTHTDKSEIIRAMKHADLIFLQVLHASQRGEQEKLIQGIRTEKLGNVIEKLYRSQTEAHTDAIIKDGGHNTTVYELKKDRIMPVISIFNECPNGIVAYVDDPLVLAELFESYLDLNLVSLDLALKQFFWNSVSNQPHERTADVLARITTSKVISIIHQLEDNWSTKALWLSYCTPSVWCMYLNWIAENYKADCYNIADSLCIAAKTDAFAKAVRNKFNDD